MYVFIYVCMDVCMHACICNTSDNIFTTFYVLEHIPATTSYLCLLDCNTLACNILLRDIVYMHTRALIHTHTLRPCKP